MVKTDATSVRGLQAGTIAKYRQLAAKTTMETGIIVSMNSLYVRALEEFIERHYEEASNERPT